MLRARAPGALVGTERSVRCLPLVPRPHVLCSRSVCKALDNLGSQQSVTAPGASCAGLGDLDIKVAEQEGSPAQGQRLGQPATAATSSHSVSWETWLSVFEEMDKNAEEAHVRQLLLQYAVREEDYAAAAEHKKALAAVQETDLVAEVQQQLAAALRTEDYKTATMLRDQGMAAVQGWWAGGSETGDPLGHLLFVGPEFGRYTGRVYTARDLAMLAGWSEGGGRAGKEALQRLRKTLSSTRRPKAAGAGQEAGQGVGAGKSGKEGGKEDSSSGSPALEVFLSKDPVTGQLVSQVVSLVGAPLAPTPAKDSSSGSPSKRSVIDTSLDADSRVPRRSDVDAVSTLLGLGPMVRLTVAVDATGAVSLRAVPPAMDAERPRPKPKSKFSAWEAEEAAATLRELADLGNSAPPPPVSNSGSLSKAVQPDEVVQAAEVPDEPLVVVQVAADLTASDSGEVVAVESQDILDDSSSVEDVLLDLQGAIDLGSSGSSDEDGQAVVVAVEIESMGSDSDEDDGTQGSAADTAPTPPAEALELQRRPATLQFAPGTKDVMLVTIPAPPSAEQAGGSAPPSNEAVPAVQPRQFDEAAVVTKYEVLVPLAKLQSADTAEAILQQMAGRIARAQSRQGGSKGDPAAAQAALAALAQRVVCGEAAEVIIPASSAKQEDDSSLLAMAVQQVSKQEVFASAAAATAQQEDSSSQPNLSAQGVTLKYTRIPADMSTADTFTGICFGSFGVHGPEVLRLQRGTLEGEEAVIATKLTGDSNIPAGQLSFRAKVGRQYRLSSKDVYPDELGVLARYKGQGQVAQKGFKEPKWVDGELLVFSKNSPLTNGAELGFVWQVPGERRFLILLNKVDLAALVPGTAGKNGQQRQPARR